MRSALAALENVVALARRARLHTVTLLLLLLLPNQFLLLLELLLIHVRLLALFDRWILLCLGGHGNSLRQFEFMRGSNTIFRVVILRARHLHIIVLI